jgi:hypothetical protein
MCREKIKRNPVYDSSSFYSDTFPLILIFYAAFYWRIYLFSSNRRWIDTDTIDRYYWSCWLPIASIYLLKIVHFWPIVSIISLKEKKFSSIKSNHRLKIFFSSKDHRSNLCFLQLIDYQYRSNRYFFRHRCPSMVGCHPNGTVRGGGVLASKGRER